MDNNNNSREKINILDAWPRYFDAPRPNQLKAFEWIKNTDAKYLFLEAPVGTGKSVIGLTLSQYLDSLNDPRRKQLGSAYFLTPQRILQSQYEESFTKSDIISLYGRSNYECATLGSNCEVGKAVYKKSCARCPASIAYKDMRSRSNVVFNYKLALLLSLVKMIKKRELVVLDECHNLEDYLTEFGALSISERKCSKYKIKWETFKSPSDALAWARKTYLPKLTEYIDTEGDTIEELVDGRRSDQFDRKILNHISQYQRDVEHLKDVEMFLEADDEYVDANFVYINDPASFKFKHLYGGKNFKTLVEPLGERFLFMSSTILDYEAFCEDLDIDPSQAAFLSLESEFPTENRPVLYMPRLRMNAKWKQPENAKSREELIETVIKLMTEYHEDDSGVIHTGNFEVSEWMVKELQGKIPHTIYHHNPSSKSNRDDVINNFIKNKTPAVLISPSVTEGLDLKEDLGRFSVFIKLPFPYLGDQWIKKRMELSSKWYMRRTLTHVIQGSGRVVRSADDWGNTYVLDASWDYLYNMSHKMIPRWWFSAFHKIR